MSSHGYRGGRGGGGRGRGAFRGTPRFACFSCGFVATSDGELKWHKQQEHNNNFVELPGRGRGGARGGHVEGEKGGRGGAKDGHGRGEGCGGGIFGRKEVPPVYGAKDFHALPRHQAKDTFPCTFTGCA